MNSDSKDFTRDKYLNATIGRDNSKVRSFWEESDITKPTQDFFYMTLNEIGKEFGVTGERIRGIQDRAIKKLQHPKISKILKEFID